MHSDPTLPAHLRRSSFRFLRPLTDTSTSQKIPIYLSAIVLLPLVDLNVRFQYQQAHCRCDQRSADAVSFGDIQKPATSAIELTCWSPCIESRCRPSRAHSNRAAVAGRLFLPSFLMAALYWVYAVDTFFSTSDMGRPTVSASTCFSMALFSSTVSLDDLAVAVDEGIVIVS